VKQRSEVESELKTHTPFYRRADVILSLLAVVAVREAVHYFDWHPVVLWVVVASALLVGARAAFQFLRQL
jgi:hypothetical protein